MLQEQGAGIGGRRVAEHFGLFLSNFIWKEKNIAFDKSGSVTWSTRVGDSLG
jgi:hypothetical protein